MDTWTLGTMVSFHGMAYYITAIMKDTERGRIIYTLNNADLRYRFLTVCRLT